MAEHVRDEVLVETRRALDVTHPEEAAAIFAELEKWVPADGALPHGPATRPVASVLDAATGALRIAFPGEKGDELAVAVLALATPWRVLAETIAYCADAGLGLRTERFAPYPPLPERPGIDWFLWGDDGRRADHVLNVVEERRADLNRALPVPLLEPAIPPGRFLVYWPDEQGTEEVHSNQGFFDYFNAPPWDTWLHYEPVHHFLVSWVPLRLVKTAVDGIARTHIECHAWLDELADPEHPRHPLRFAFPRWLRALAARPFP